MSKRYPPLFLLALALCYLLPQMVVPFSHVDLDPFGDEGPANCPGCFLAAHGQFGKLPAFVLPIYQVVVEKTVIRRVFGCRCFFGLAVKSGGNKSPPFSHSCPSPDCYL